MAGFLRVDDGVHLPQSPTNLFLADEVASTCPLITPSPPTNDLINPLPEPLEAPAFIIGEELANKLQSVKDDDHLKTDDGVETSGKEKTQCTQLTFRNPPDDYCFMTWNWPLIRKVCTWSFGALLVAMTALVISMVSSLPNACNPRVRWYQGSVFYEIFPASFHDTDKDGVGDLTGITYYAGYLQDLGVGALRLNSIFPSPNFPSQTENVSNLLEIEPQLGTLNTFKILADSLRLRNISLVLDLPLYPHVKTLTNATEAAKVTEAIRYWVHLDVDGFYLKGLERFAEEASLWGALHSWKQLIGPDRAIIVSETMFKVIPDTLKDTILKSVDLIDIRLNVQLGVATIRSQIETLQNSTFFTKAAMPWIHWSIGDMYTERLANRLHFGNATIGATLLQLMLPGTPSIFYGDEIGLQQIGGQLGQLATMIWPNRSFTEHDVLPWTQERSQSPNHSPWRQTEMISKMTRLRRVSPSIYLNAVRRDGHTKANCQVKYSQDNLLVIQRYYPRRKSFVVVSNLGQAPENADLSELLYSGRILVGLIQSDAKTESISFKNISLWPGQSVVIVLD